METQKIQNDLKTWFLNSKIVKNLINAIDSIDDESPSALITYDEYLYEEFDNNHKELIDGEELSNLEHLRHHKSYILEALLKKYIIKIENTEDISVLTFNL